MDGTNPKRQRRPNVRLGEIGNVSAAALCGTSQRPAENWDEEVWKSQPTNLEEVVRQTPFGFSKERVKPQKPYFEKGNISPRDAFGKGIGASKRVGQDEHKRGLQVDPLKMKGRHAKLRPHCAKGVGFGDRMLKNGHAGDDTVNQSMKCTVEDELESHRITNDAYEEFKDSDYENPASPCDTKDVNGTSKDLSPDAVVVNFDHSSSPHMDAEWNEPDSDRQLQADSGEYLEMHNYKERKGGSFRDANCSELPCGGTSRSGNLGTRENSRDPRAGSVEKVPPFMGRISGISVDTVKGWLDELGFSKYEHMFEIHEVDKEVLPLLTFEDLREMGINVVGPRRKIYTAIQMLKEGFSP